MERRREAAIGPLPKLATAGPIERDADGEAAIPDHDALLEPGVRAAIGDAEAERHPAH